MNNFEIWNNASNTLYLLALIFGVASLIMFFRFDIWDIIENKTGIAQKRARENMQKDLEKLNARKITDNLEEETSEIEEDDSSTDDQVEELTPEQLPQDIRMSLEKTTKASSEHNQENNEDNDLEDFIDDETEFDADIDSDDDVETDILETDDLENDTLTSDISSVDKEETVLLEDEEDTDETNLLSEKKSDKSFNITRIIEIRHDLEEDDDEEVSQETSTDELEPIYS